MELKGEQKPLVVATLSGKDILRKAIKSQKAGAGIIEIRFDLLEDPSPYNCLNILKKIRKSINIPIITTIRRKGEGGNYPDGHDRLILFSKLIPISDFVDIELKSKIVKEVVRMARKQHKKVIISYHSFSTTPSVDKLKRIYSSALKYKPDIVKIVTKSEKLKNIAELVKFMRYTKSKTAVFSVGRLGELSRYIMPYFGSCLIYGHVGEKIYKGQPSIKSLLTLFK